MEALTVMAYLEQRIESLEERLADSEKELAVYKNMFSIFDGENGKRYVVVNGHMYMDYNNIYDVDTVDAQQYIAFAGGSGDGG